MTPVANSFHNLIEPYSSFAPGIENYCLPFLRIPSVDVKDAQVGGLRRWVIAHPGKVISLLPKSFYVLGWEEWREKYPFNFRAIAWDIAYGIRERM